MTQEVFHYLLGETFVRNEFTKLFIVYFPDKFEAT